MSATTTLPARWSLGGLARVYSWSQCRYCGRAQNHDCPVVECLLCGSPQCHGNGSSNGLCAVCHHGFLPGWSRTHLPRAYTGDGGTIIACQYAGCDHEGIAIARRKPVCLAHAERIKVGKAETLAAYVARRIAHRDSGAGWERWRLV